MKAIDLIRTALAFSDRAATMLIEDMRNAPLTSPTPNGGNHPLWVLGHIAFVEGSVGQTIFGTPNPVAHWAPLFAPGTEPTTDPQAYPPFEEILRTYKDLRAKNLKLLDEIGDAGLDQPTKAPPKGLEEALRTAGQTFLVVALHQMNHRGQVADARRAAHRKPLFTPGPPAA